MTSAILGVALLVALGIIGPLVWVVIRELRASAGIMRERDIAVAKRERIEAEQEQRRKDTDALRAQLGVLRTELEQARDDLDGCRDPAVVRDRLQRLFPLAEAGDGRGAGDIAVPSWVDADPAPDRVDD